MVVVPCVPAGTVLVSVRPVCSSPWRAVLAWVAGGIVVLPPGSTAVVPSREVLVWRPSSGRAVAVDVRREPDSLVRELFGVSEAINSRLPSLRRVVRDSKLSAKLVSWDETSLLRPVLVVPPLYESGP